MPPKVKFDKETIIDQAFDYVRKNGWEGLSARYLAARLNASTAPIYTHFASMTELENEVVKKSLQLYFKSLEQPITGDKWMDSGIALLRFAMEEKHLFRCMNDEKHSVIQREHSRAIWHSLGDELADYPLFEGLSEAQKNRIRAVRWWLIQGMASLINNGWYGDNDEMDLEHIVEVISIGLIKGLKDASLSIPKTKDGEK